MSQDNPVDLPSCGVCSDHSALRFAFRPESVHSCHQSMAGHIVRVFNPANPLWFFVCSASRTPTMMNLGMLLLGCFSM
jgi:hypothetical protein